MMQDYSELIKALRCHGSGRNCGECTYFDIERCSVAVANAAADALEGLLKTRTDELNAAYRQGYDAAAMEAKKYKAFTDCSESPNS